jgi:dTDP-4-amino-4,6-dideoxygalactose transaminase
MKLPLSRPFLGVEDEEAIIEIIKSKYIASGQVTKAFEESLALRFNRKYGIVVNSGTSALYISLKILGLKTVILPSITCPQVLHATASAGCRPVFADVEMETHNIDLSAVPEERLKGSDGIIVTHTYGHPTDMDMIAYYTKKYNLNLIEDFAQAMGGNFKGKTVGSLGDVSTTSFYAGKNMTTGCGGAVLTDDPEVYKKCLHIRGDTPYNYYEGIVPLNFQITDIQSALGLVQLKKMDKMVDMRRSVAHKLTILLNELGMRTPVEKSGVKHAYYKYHLVLPKHIRKQEFIVEMNKQDVSTGILYDPPLHKTLLAKHMFDTDIRLPISEDIAPRTVSLPIFPEMTDSDISQICHAVDKTIRNLR